jgi:hypothetical protein
MVSPRLRFAPFLLGLFLIPSACGDQATEPETPVAGPPSFAVTGIKSCPIQATVVVTDEMELVAAVESAAPGDVIGIDGIIELTNRIRIYTDEVTLTCATPGSGLAPGPGMVGNNILLPYARAVRIDRLVLGGGINRIIYAAYYGDDVFMSDALEVTNNWMHCEGGLNCIFMKGVKNAVISGNYIEVMDGASGIHIERTPIYDEDGNFLFAYPTDGTRIENNTIVALGPMEVKGGRTWMAGIRPRDGTGMVIANNTVLGPWLNSIATAELIEGLIQGNQLEGAQFYGIALSANAYTGFSAVGNVIRGNRIDSGELGQIRARYACDNQFQGNSVATVDPSVGVLFDLETGANFWLGNNKTVTDLGDYDCDGDGNADPNFIAGG